MPRLFALIIILLPLLATAQHPQPEARWRIPATDDPLLDSLIAEAVESNYDIAIAARRIRAAEAAVASARAAYFPNIGLSAGYGLTREDAMTRRAWSLGANASWEIDLFGRVTAAVREQRELRNVARAEADGAMVSVVASLASAYIQMRAAQAQTIVAQAHLAEQDTVVRIAEARHRAQLVSGLDVAQATTLRAATNASIPALVHTALTSANAIAILLGREPGEVAPRLLDGRIHSEASMIVPDTIPADRLRSRPDVIAAERTVEARAAALGVSKKEFLPILALRGSFAFEAPHLNGLFHKNSVTYSVEPTLTWTLFDGLGRRAAVAAARAEMETAIAQYQQTLLTASSEVANALSAYSTARRQVADLEATVASARREVRLSLDQYRSGLTLFTPVAQAMSGYLQYDQQLVQARAAQATAIADLYRALGGNL